MAKSKTEVNFMEHLKPLLPAGGDASELEAAAQALAGLSPEDRDLLAAVQGVALSFDHPRAVLGVSRKHRVFCPGAQHPQGGGCGLALSGAAFGRPSAPGTAGRY